MTQRADSVYFIAILALRVLAHETDALRTELARLLAHAADRSSADRSGRPVVPAENEHVINCTARHPHSSLLSNL